MMVRVIYKDQTAGVVESHLLNDLINKGRIVAYHSSDHWIPIEHAERKVVNGNFEIREGFKRYNLH
jgi:hypothetical protein